MTLKEQFDTISCRDCRMHYADIKCTMLSENELNKFEQIADVYALGFAVWLHDLNLEIIDLRSVQQLLANYKKEKKL